MDKVNAYTLEAANHSDYRDFLKARFAALKASSPRFSVQSLARKSGVSKSLIQFLFKKERHLALDRLPRFARALKIERDEEHFLYLLACKNISRAPEMHRYFEEILGRIRHQYVKTGSAEPPSRDGSRFLFSNSTLMALHSLARLKGFREDPAWIVENLKIPHLTAATVKAALLDLEEKGALRRDSSGTLRPENFPFMRPDPLAPKSFDVYREGARSVVNLMEEAESYRPSVYMLLSLAFDEERLKTAEKLMIELHGQLRALASESTEPTATVYCGNFFMTLSRLSK